MKKKQYNTPQFEVMAVNMSLMQAFHEASMPTDPFNSGNGAPKKKTEVF